jgi:hypothetical protein
MRVQALLKTPLYRGRFGPDHATRHRSSVTEIRGEATVRDGGLDIVVASMHDEKGNPVDSPLKRVFVPLGKIDFYVIEADT